MKIRTTEQLYSKLDEELAWRKKELSSLKYVFDRVSGRRDQEEVLGRCGVAMLYAHWEGFVKKSSKYFLEYLYAQRLRNEDLKPHFLTLSLRSSVAFSPTSKKNSEFGKLTDFFLNRITERAKFPFKDGLDTASNLSSTVFKEIVWSLGLNYEPYKTKEQFLDKRLLGKRNHIAHGEEEEIDVEEFLNMRTIVLEMMTWLKDDIQNSVVEKRYRV